MAQFLIVRERLLRELGAMDYVKHIIVTTDAESGSADSADSTVRRERI